MLTAQLAPRCNRLLACDATPEAAVVAAQARTAGLPAVRVELRVIPREWPSDPFELIVFSELLYYFGYFGDPDLDQVIWLLARLAHYRDPDFTAQVYARSDGDRRSVTRVGGIV